MILNCLRWNHYKVAHYIRINVVGKWLALVHNKHLNSSTTLHQTVLQNTFD